LLLLKWVVFRSIDFPPLNDSEGALTISSSLLCCLSSALLRLTPSLLRCLSSSAVVLEFSAATLLWLSFSLEWPRCAVVFEFSRLPAAPWFWQCKLMQVARCCVTLTVCNTAANLTLIGVCDLAVASISARLEARPYRASFRVSMLLPSARWSLCSSGVSSVTKMTNWRRLFRWDIVRSNNSMSMTCLSSAVNQQRKKTKKTVKQQWKLTVGKKTQFPKKDVKTWTNIFRFSVSKTNNNKISKCCALTIDS